MSLRSDYYWDVFYPYFIYSEVSLFCVDLCQIVSLQYLSTSSLHRLAGLPLCLFLSYYRGGGGRDSTGLCADVRGGITTASLDWVETPSLLGRLPTHIPQPNSNTITQQTYTNTSKSGRRGATRSAALKRQSCSNDHRHLASKYQYTVHIYFLNITKYQ